MLRFRKLRADDAGAPVWQDAPLTGLLPDGLDHINTHLMRGDILFALFDDERPVGLLTMNAEPLGEKPCCLIIEQIILLPEYRRHGLGRMLMTLAAGEAVERKIWFLGGRPPQTPEAEGFAKAIHMKQTDWFDDLLLLDLSDVEGLRHG
ncbi:MAG: GNAT family N-acetyltransferase [Oscillospiraceae bacterium]|nr:GNAT family N-acetyltransferase [Oscillospiraceae bacterium]